ncbi:MAG: 7TM-DISM domain-containing protein, partial [Pseudobdellovibrionaceae bacterium]|nr:7TM-DISM domain-containing protein [Pseudobdellovibrionaceae bacterium]
LSPDEFLQRIQSPDFKPDFLEVGKSFSAIDPKRIVDNSGYGTFVLRLRGLPPGFDLAYRGLSAYSASRVYVFDRAEPGRGIVRGESGKVGKDASSMVPRMQNYSIQSLGIVNEQDHFFLIQVSNFHHRKGGLWLPPEIGPSALLQQGREQDVQSNFFFMGMMAFIVLYNLSFYSRRLEDKGPLWLALTTTVLLIRSFSYSGSQFDFLGISETTSFELRWKIFYMTIPVAPILFMQFASSYFPAQLSPRTVRRFWLLAIPCALFVLVTPTRIFSQFVNPISAIGSLIGLASIYGQLRATHAGEKGALISLLGSCVVFIGSMLDLLWSKGFTFLPTNCTGITITLFVIAQSQIVAVRFAAAFRQAEHLGRALQSEVEKQTRDIKSILRSIKQGIFTLVQPHGTVGSQYSDHLRDIVGKERIEGETLDRLLLDHSQIGADEKNMMGAALGASLGEDAIAFDANEHGLVRELNTIHRAGTTSGTWSWNGHRYLRKTAVSRKSSYAFAM